MNKLFCIAFVTFLCTAFAQAGNVTVTVKNTSNRVRNNETVELNAANIKKQVGSNIIVTRNNKQIPYQITYDGKLIFQATVPSKGSAQYTIKPGTPQTFKSKATGRLYPEREDDMAWENDRIAFRCYGPALQRTEEKAYGNDVWVKSTNDFVCEFRYGQEYRAKSIIKALRAAGKKAEAQHYEDSISYHIDHGKGLDCYKVGPTLGDGTIAFLEDGKIIYPYCFDTQQVLDNGPIRFTVRLTYPVAYKGVAMREIRITSIDAGSQLNRVTVSYTGQKEALPVVVGIVLHDGSKDYNLSAEKGYAAYTENAGKDGLIYLGMAFPNKVQSINTLPLREDEAQAKSQGADGHIIALMNVPQGSEFMYYWGAGWSKFGFKNSNDWVTYMSNFAKNLRTPLIVTAK